MEIAEQQEKVNLAQIVIRLLQPEAINIRGNILRTTITIKGVIK